jgi:hypothetical protein
MTRDSDYPNGWTNRNQHACCFHQRYKIVLQNMGSRITVEFTDGYQVETWLMSIEKRFTKEKKNGLE